MSDPKQSEDTDTNTKGLCVSNCLVKISTFKQKHRRMHASDTRNLHIDPTCPEGEVYLLTYS